MAGLALLVAGGRGQLGSELAKLACARAGSLVHAPGSAELDITDAGAVTDAVESFAETAGDAGLRPVVVNAAAFTAVDAAEQDSARAAELNTDGATSLANACRQSSVPMVHVSTDYVFPGDAARPYEPDDLTGPRTVYGRTKLDGENAVLDSGARAWVVRTSWVYGAKGSNFVKTMIRLASQRATLSVVDDQIGSPTWTGDLASGLIELADAIAHRDGPEAKVLHCSNSGQASWFEFARAVFDEIGADPQRVQPCTSAEYPQQAPRPAYSVLSQRVWNESGCTPLRPWYEALSAAFKADGDAFRGR